MFRRFLSAIWLIIWLVGLIALYFWAHKPFNEAVLAGLGKTIGSLAVTIWLVWLAAALGWRLGQNWLADETPAGQLTLTIGLGLGLLSLLVLGLGLAALLYAWLLWLVMIGLSLALRREMGQVWRLGRGLKGLRPEQPWLQFFTLLTLLLTFLVALTPANRWDALVYHLTGPKLFIANQRIDQVIDLPYLGFPQLGEMQFTLGLLLISDRVANLLQFVYGLLTLVLVAKLSGREAQWYAVAILLSAPTLLGLMTTAYVDITLLFYLTAAIYAFLKWEGNPQQLGWLWLMAAFGGYCWGVKYTAVVVPAGLALAILWVSGRQALRPILYFGLVVGLVGSPWLLENWLTTGNPFYPFILDSGRYWDAWRGWWYDRPGTGLLATSPLRLLFAPLEATVLGREGTIYYDATIGPLLLGAAGALPLVWGALESRHKKMAGYLTLYVGLNFLLWLVGLARSALLLQTRLLLPVFGVVAVLGGLAMSQLAALRLPRFRTDWVAKSFFSLTLALLLAQTVADFFRLNPLPVALGLESESHFLGRQLGVYQTVIEELNQLPAGTHIQFLWEPRSYGCTADCRPDALLDHFLHLSQHERLDAAGMARAWQTAGVSHLLLNQGGLDFVVADGFDPISADDLAILAQLERDYLRPVAEWGQQYRLYELLPPAP